MNAGAEGAAKAKRQEGRGRHRATSLIAMNAVFALAGCGGEGAGPGPLEIAIVANGGGGSAPAVVSVPISKPTPTPTSLPTTSVSETSGSLSGLSPVASGIDLDEYLVKSWGSGDVAASSSPDVVGAFRFICTPSHNAYDDPIVYPGQSGKSHLHTFFGNTAADAHSTYSSLRTTGESTCNNLLNRSAYWVPAMLTTTGKVVMPNYISIYYKRRPETDPECKREGIACVGLPRGLRYIFGYNMASPSGAGGEFVCDNNNVVTGPFSTIPEAAKACPVGAKLGARLGAPSCWNGRDLDSADHRSHMAYPSYGNWGYLKCPATHPYVVPTFTLAAWYVTDPSLDRSGDMSPDAKTWYLASDRMAGMARQTPGTTLHADWFGAWEDSVMKLWTDHCINRMLNCSGGDLGNGQQLRMSAGYTWSQAIHLVDAPARPL